MPRPTPGLMLPVNVARVRDGDTVEVQIAGSAFIWPVRLIDCWAPETRGPRKQYGELAKQHAQQLLAGRELFLHIPLPHTNNLLGNLTFDRIPGYIWIADETLNQRMVDDGYATREKTDALPPRFHDG